MEGLIFKTPVAVQEQSGINGYKLLGDFSSKDAGMSRWTFCKKDGREYFIKELLSPVYPIDRSAVSEKKYRIMVETCDAFQKDRENFYQILGQKCNSGNSVIPTDFFRFGSHFYVIQPKLSFERIPIEKIAKSSVQVKNILCCSLLYSINLLHKQGIVHSDLKPDNILVKRTQGEFLTGKIIDFESGFQENLQNFVEGELVGDQVYMSPEAFLHIEEDYGPVTCKSDIFSLGLILHLFWTGKLPNFEDDYAFLAVLNGTAIAADPSIPKRVRTMIMKMLSLEPDERPTAEEALLVFKPESLFSDPKDLG